MGSYHNRDDRRHRLENHLQERKLVTVPDCRVGDHRIPVIYAISPLVLPRPTEWDSRIYMSGYWFDSETSDWVPPESLQDFLEMPFSGSLFATSCIFVIMGIGVLALVKPGELTLNIFSKDAKAEAPKENEKHETAEKKDPDNKADDSFRYEPLYERTPVKKEEAPEKAPEKSKPSEDGVKQMEVKEMVLKEEPIKEGPLKEETIKEVALKEIDQAMVKDGQEGEKMI